MPNFDLTFRFLDGTEKEVSITDEQFKGNFEDFMKVVAKEVLPNKNWDYKKWNYMISGETLKFDKPLINQKLSKVNCVIRCALKFDPK